MVGAVAGAKVTGVCSNSIHNFFSIFFFLIYFPVQNALLHSEFKSTETGSLEKFLKDLWQDFFIKMFCSEGRIFVDIAIKLKYFVIEFFDGGSMVGNFMDILWQ